MKATAARRPAAAPAAPGVLRRQRGAVLLIMLGIVLLISASVLLGHLNAAVRPPSAAVDANTRDTLARAKTALIAWAATHPDTPGLLPFPDRNDDAVPAYDGAADCEPAATLAANHLLGRYPVLGEDTGGGCAADIPMDVEVDDSAGERLWYAVSRNLVRGGGGGPVNPDIGDLALQPWITVRDATGAVVSNRVAAVIIAPGAALGAQDRSGVAPAASGFLDTLAAGGNTYDNSDADGCSDVGCAPTGEEFIVSNNPQATDLFNDRVLYITVDELMHAVEDRVLGEAAMALRQYRNSSAFPNDYYPWLAPFTQPRLSQGTATGGGATTLVNGTANFGADGIVDGDLVRNLADGSIGLVATGGVSANTLTLEGLIGGTANAFAAGDSYMVHSADKFRGVPGTVEGLMPVHIPNEIFQTGFTVTWAFANTPDEIADPTVVGGNVLLQPAKAVVDSGTITVPVNQGACKWTQSDRVDCRGWVFIAGGGIGGSDRTVEVWFNFTDAASIVAPTGGDVRRRNHAYNGNYFGPVFPVAAPDLPQVDWAVRMIDDDGTVGACAPLGTATNCGWRVAKPDVATTLNITLTGIRYDIGVGAGQELPAWFADNNWHQFVSAVASGANLPATGSTSGDGTCTPPPVAPPFVTADAADYCLQVQYNSALVRDDVEALVLGSGSQLTVVLGQDRDAAGAACPASQPVFLCDYFEFPNSRDFTADYAPSPAPRNVIFGRSAANTFDMSTTFNDQIRAVPPP